MDDRFGGAGGGAPPPRGAVGGLVGLLALGGGVWLFNNALFNGMYHHISHSPLLDIDIALSRWWPSRNQVHTCGRRWQRHLQRRHAYPSPVVRNSHHLRRPRKTSKRSFPDRHEGSADGKHHLSCPLASSNRCAAANISDTGHRLR